jgi:CubicO group peptidase (beta-lactamase class C family)
MSERFDPVRTILRQAVEAHAFPAACIEVGNHEASLWNAAAGAFTFDPYAPPATPDTIFDLASLTKVIATTALAMRAIDAGRLTLDDRVSDWLRSWRGADRASVTIRQLLTHSSGLTAYLPFFRDYTGRFEFESAIGSLPLEYPPGTQSIYSDLGFMLLGFILEDAVLRARGRQVGAFDPEATLAHQFERLSSFVTSEPLTFNPARAWRSRCAPTEIDAWRGRMLIGEVHDENCWALGGAAGHAGLFGTAAAVGSFARAVLATLAGDSILSQPATMRAFIQRDDVPGSSRALGWDTMRPTSSCGTRMSPTAIGHTGFTGTSLWIDWERDVYVVLLTNRVHPTRENNAIRHIRPRIHDAVMDALAG